MRWRVDRPTTYDSPDPRPPARKGLRSEDRQPVLPLTPSTLLTYEGRQDGQPREVTISVTHDTKLKPDVVENKYYARGIGEVRNLMVKGGVEKMNLVSVSTGG